MKTKKTRYYSFFPGFLVALAFALLLTVNVVFKLNLPLIKDIGQPVLALFIAGFLMCAFGTIGNSMQNIYKDSHIDWLVILMILIGVAALVLSGFAIFSKEPVMGFLSKSASYYTIAGLIVLKIVIASIRVSIIKKGARA